MRVRTCIWFFICCQINLAAFKDIVNKWQNCLDQSFILQFDINDTSSNIHLYFTGKCNNLCTESKASRMCQSRQLHLQYSWDRRKWTHILIQLINLNFWFEKLSISFDYLYFYYLLLFSISLACMYEYPLYFSLLNLIVRFSYLFVMPFYSSPFLTIFSH